MNKWIEQLWCVDACICTYIQTYIYMYIALYIYIIEFYLALEKETLPFATTWMNLENIMLIEISQT
jgi:hypothetical protein